ncbi:MAG: hypothetical protein MK066_09375 [Crocinitomicaceae bacterium]|nr:hypothetical protein [Crocinitomicaceae bacterium]
MTKLKITFACVGSLFLLFSCGEPQTIQNKITKIERIPVVLSRSDLFETAQIFAFLQNEEKEIDEANQLYMHGLDSFKNKKDLDSAVQYLEASILKEPTAKAYYDLGNVYMSKEEYDIALKAYDLAEQLEFQPFSKILYNKACIYSLKKEEELAGHYLEYALQGGYSNLEHIGKDEDLKNLREKGWIYKNALKKGMRGMSNTENLFWLQFKRQFPKRSLPIELPITILESESGELTFVSYEFERYISEMRDEKFSREVSKGFYHFAQAYETEKFVAIVYVVKEEFLGAYAPLQYRLATFTHEGKLIDKKNIGGSEVLGGELLSATLKENFTVDIDIVEVLYENDPESYGYMDNPILSTEIIGAMQYVIQSNGKIAETEGYENDISENY